MQISGVVLYTGGSAVRAAVERDVASRANLIGADLRGADLIGADLIGADLRGADLRGANIDGEPLTRAPISILNLRWRVLITGSFMRIGCERHTHAEWAAFEDRQIAAMDRDDALEFWREWKAPLLAMCTAHAAGVEKPALAEAQS